MIRFLFGDQGTGKSTWIYEYLTREAEAHPDRRYFLFVPEQNTLKAQQMLIRTSRRRGMLNLDVLSFQLCSYRVMEELGMEKPVILDDILRSVLLRRACGSVKKELSVYQSKTGKPGFLAKLRETFSEFSQYGIGEEALLKASAQTDSGLLRGKLSDLSLILNEYSRLKAGYGSTPEEVPALLLTVISRSHLLDNAVLCFDGYTGFTPLQLSLLSHMMEKASECVFSVTIPPDQKPYRLDRADEADLFRLSRETVRNLCETAEKGGIPRGEDICLEKRFTDPELSLLQAEDPQEEVKALVRKIRELYAESDGALSLSRTAVALTDPGTYRTLLRGELEAAGIPYFMDDRSDGSSSAALSYLGSALDAVCGGFRHEDVIAFARNPLLSGVPRKRALADVLDNLLRAGGIRGLSAFQRDFSLLAAPPGVLPEDVEAYKNSLIGPLFALRDDLKAAGTIGLSAECCMRFLKNTDAAGLLSSYTGLLETLGYQREAEDERRFYALLETLLGRLSELMGEERSSRQEFRELLLAAFTEMKAGSIPQKLSMLTVGDMKRSRFEDIDHLFLLGANEGLLPSAATGGGMFTDRERREIMDLGIRMAPDDLADTLIQEFYLHTLLLTPRKKAFVSWSLSGRDGKKLLRSAFLDRWKERLGLAVRNAGFEGLPSADDAAGLFASRLSEAGPEVLHNEKEAEELSGLCRILSSEPALEKRAEALLSARFDRSLPDGIPAETAARLYPADGSTSVSRIETFERCPYRHYLSYGLRLSERKEYELEAADLGTLYHAVLETVFTELKKEKKDIAGIPEEELTERTRAAVRTVTADYNRNILQSTGRNRFIAENLERISVKTVRTLRTQLAAGDFHVYGSELDFKAREGNVRIHGRIDRLDTFEEKDRVLVRVVDYKSGSMEFRLDLVLEGLSLQLVTYLDQALKTVGSVYRGREAVPAGMLIYRISDPVVDPEEAAKAGPEKASERKLRMDGLVNADAEILTHMDRSLREEGTRSSVIPAGLKKGAPDGYTPAVSTEDFAVIRAYAGKRIAADLAAIQSGSARILPVREGEFTACSYCPYRAVCGFDRRLPEYNYRKIRPKKADAALEGMKHEVFG